jgi:hypothetical protein
MKSDHERFCQDLEQIAQKISSLNVAGIPEGLTDDLSDILRAVIGLKHKARFIGSRYPE